MPPSSPDLQLVKGGKLVGEAGEVAGVQNNGARRGEMGQGGQIESQEEGETGLCHTPLRRDLK